MDVFEAMNTRISVPALMEPGPTDTQWEVLLRAGARAPDHGRLRPWRFLIVRGAARELLGDVMAEALRVNKPATPSETLDRERRKPLRAPALLVVAVVPVPHAGVPEDRANPGRRRRGPEYSARRPCPWTWRHLAHGRAGL